MRTHIACHTCGGIGYMAANCRAPDVEGLGKDSGKSNPHILGKNFKKIGHITATCRSPTIKGGGQEDAGKKGNSLLHVLTAERNSTMLRIVLGTAVEAG